MKTQHKINREQEQTNDEQIIINDKTRFDLKFNNVWAILIAIVAISASWFNLSTRVDLLTQKVDILVESQKEMTNEFRQWKTQAENRLGTVESNQNTVISYVENHLQVKIR